MIGYIKFWNEHKNWGYIAAENGKDYFAGGPNLRNKNYHPQKNDSVTFELGENQKGVCAKLVGPAENPIDEIADFNKAYGRTSGYTNEEESEETIATALGGHA